MIIYKIEMLSHFDDVSNGGVSILGEKYVYTADSAKTVFEGCKKYICYGIVTTNDLHQTAIRYGLSDEESQELADRIQREGVHLHTEEEKYELLPTMHKFHGVELPSIPKPPTPDERLTKIMCGELPTDPNDLEIYTNTIAEWESRIAADELTAEVYQMKRNGATIDDIAQRLETSADNILIVEEKILRAFRYAVQKAGRRRVHLVRAKKIRDYYQ